MKLFSQKSKFFFFLFVFSSTISVRPRCFLFLLNFFFFPYINLPSRQEKRRQNSSKVKLERFNSEKWKINFTVSLWIKSNENKKEKEKSVYENSYHVIHLISDFIFSFKNAHTTHLTIESLLFLLEKCVRCLTISRKRFNDEKKCRRLEHDFFFVS